MYVLDVSIKLFPGDDIRYHCENANTLIGAAILKLGHPYIWARYRESITYYHHRHKGSIN